MTAATREPTDLLIRHVEDCCWAATGWEDAAWGSVRDARTVTRGKAAAAFSSETTGYLPDVRVWKRYIRLWTYQDAWEYSGRERAVDDYSYDHDVDYAIADQRVPELAPRDYEPNEGTPAWEFVHASDPDAIPVWVCGVKGDRAPTRPVRREATAS